MRSPSERERSPVADPSTPALAALDAAGIGHEVVVREPSRSVEEAAAKRGVAVSALIKTLVVRLSEGRYVFVLVPGDRAIDWGKLRAHLGERRLSLPDAVEAHAATGYERGAITPFGGSTTQWPVIVERAVLDHDVVSLGGGAQGVSVRLPPGPMVDALVADVADVTKAR